MSIDHVVNGNQEADIDLVNTGHQSLNLLV